MKLKKTRLIRTCNNCGRTIQKGEMYGQQTKSILGQQSLNGGEDWIPYRITKTIDICSDCAN